MISRTDWLDAIRTSGLPASRRQVLATMADFWPRATTRPVLWVAQQEIVARTGLSAATIKRAWRDAEDAGYLVMVEAHRQHRAPRYAPVIPPAQTGHSDRSDPVDNDAQTGHSDRSTQEPDSARPVTLLSQTGHSDRRIQLESKNQHHHRPSSTSLTAAALAMVVVEELPETLAAGVRRRVLADALGAAEAAGWTPDLIRAAARAHGWASARHGGAVVEWARDLGDPPAPQLPPAPPQLCETHGTRYRGVCSGCRADAIAAPRAAGAG